MSKHPTEVRYLLTDAKQLVDALGWGAKSKKTSEGISIRCPSHQDTHPSCSITKGPDGTLRAHCFSCNWSADALGMIAIAHGLNPDVGDDFREILAIGAHIGGDLRLEDEIRGGQQFVGQPPRTPVPAPPPEPERDYPDIAEVGQLWAMAEPCDSDADAFEILRARAIDPSVAAQRDLGRVIGGRGATLPAWATHGRVSWHPGGYRLIVRVWDSNGKPRSVRAWQIAGLDGPKRVPPTGCKAAELVLANKAAVAILLKQAKPGRVLICEGEPDWLTWATRVPNDVAVFGIGSGSWTKEHAERVPKGSEVLILTHCDPAGDKYAEHVAKTFGDSVQVWRLNGPKGVDENDKAQRGQLPNDPRAQCEPLNDTARKVAEEEPRVFTVREMIQVVHKRLISNEKPVMWTSGHWKVDVMTGGLRPDSGWVIGAASNWGKSTWLIAMCDENMRASVNPTVPLIVSGEDSEELYAQRLLARRARVNALRLRDNQLRPDEHKRVCSVLNKSEPKPHYLDGRGVTFERLLRQMVSLIKQHNIKIVALDYIQEFRTKQKYESERVMFREIARMYRHTMKRYGVASVVMTQVTAPQQGKAPNKDNIRECKDIGHGAEVIGMGWEPDEDVQDKNGRVLYEAKSKLLLLDKTKSGLKGHVELEWDPVSACFNKTMRPYGQRDELDVAYEANADTTCAWAQFDELDAALGATDGFPAVDDAGLGTSDL